MLDNGKRKVDLPGSLLDIKGMIGNVVGAITGEASHPNPINHPLSVAGVKLPGGPGDAFYQPANVRNAYNGPSSYVFYQKYWNSASFKNTLENLCPLSGSAPVVSLLELKTLLNASPYYTTPGRFSTVTKGMYKAQTLDTNMYWEVLIYPFCCSTGKSSNGGWSYLPSIREINVENKLMHNVTTNYGAWAPISSFELQKSKLSTKSIPLFDGEIQVPSSLEYTNELRLTFVDDSWKSWKKYFEKCQKVSVCNSKPHTAAHYVAMEPPLTEIDESMLIVAMYKNVAFQIDILVLNPQLNTLKKYTLLCVLKDFSEEYVGETESSGTDLVVTFSIVGENPKTNDAKTMARILPMIEEGVDIVQLGVAEVQKTVVGAIKNSIGLL